MTRTDRLLKLAHKRGDVAAVAILEADRRFRPIADRPLLYGALWRGLRWSGYVGPRESAWWPR